MIPKEEFLKAIEALKQQDSIDDNFQTHMAAAFPGSYVENPNEIDPRIPVEIDPLFFFQLAPRFAKFSRQAEPIYRVTKQPFSAISRCS